jgi:proline racemase
MRWSKMLTVVGAHAEGEVGQVITGGVTGVPGATMGDKMRHLNEVDDRLRRFTLFEPRGNPHMSVNLLLPPTRPDADAGFIVMQADRCHPMSGSNAMCVVTVLLETGMLPMQEPTTRVALDTPAGLVVAAARCRDGRCERVALEFVPSFALHLDHALEVDGLGTLAVDVAWGGDWFCLVDAVSCGFAVRPDEVRDMIELGGRIKRAAHEQIALRHPTMPETGNISFAMFCARPEAPGAPYRNGTVMHPGRMDRSPCGTGTAARLAVMHARGEIAVGETLTMRSVIDSEFQATIIGATTLGEHPAVLPRISGRAWIYGLYQLGLDPSDPYPLGYTVADAWGPGDA